MYMKTITIIPAYNEEKTIRMVVKEAKRHVDEVVVVYDKSGDKTLEEIQDLCDIITIKRRRGKGYALRLGFVYALKKKYDIIVMIDADGEKDPREIGKLIEYLKNEYADMVVGTRDSFRSKWRKTFNLFTSWWINLATGYNLTDVSSGFNVYHYLSLKKMSLKSNSFEIEIEIILEAKKNNLKVIGHPISSPYISRSKLGFRHAIEINNFFDK